MNNEIKIGDVISAKGLGFTATVTGIWAEPTGLVAVFFCREGREQFLFASEVELEKGR